MADYYAVLGVDRRASQDEIKKAFRRLTREHHPDRHPNDPEAADRYRQINEAYNVLGDAAARARYDTTVRLPQGIDLRGFEGQSARDMFGNMFGDVFRNRRRAHRRGRDLRYTLTVDFADAVLGSTHEIAFEAYGPCDTCKGSGVRPGGKPPETCPVCSGRGEIKGDGLFAPWTRCGRCNGTGLLQVDPCETCTGSGKRRQKRAFVVRLPPATSSGAEKVLERQGEPGRFGGEAGDLRVTINVRPHRWLEQRGDEIRCELPVSISEAALGARLPVPTVDGIVMVDVPAGVRSGTKLRLRGKGVPIARDKRTRGGPDRGDQLVTVVVETPVVGDDARLRELLRELASLSETPSVLPRRAAWQHGVGDGAAEGVSPDPGGGSRKD